jgi:hypothetical protein
METNWFTSWGWIVCIVIGLLIIFGFIIKGFKNPVEYPDNYEDEILRKQIDVWGRKTFGKDKNCPDENSPENLDLPKVEKRVNLHKDTMNVDYEGFDEVNFRNGLLNKK